MAGFCVSEIFGKPDGVWKTSRWILLCAKVADLFIVKLSYMCYSNVTQMAILVICKRYLFNFIHFGGSEYRVLFQSDERVTSEYRLGREPGAVQDVI